MRRSLISKIAVLPTTLVAFAISGAANAQAVHMSGKLKIGFGDQTNALGARRNNAVPACAGAGPLVNPGTVGTTVGTLLVNMVGSAVPGVGGTVTFNAFGNGNGGAQQKLQSTCIASVEPFANPNYRTRIQHGSAHWPGRRGKFTSMILSAPVPATPTATYTLMAGGGYTQTPTVFAWTTRDEIGFPGSMGSAAPTTMNAFTGSALEATIPFYGSGIATLRYQPEGVNFGGGVPYSGASMLRLGLNDLGHQAIGGSFTPFPPHSTFGQADYANGFLPSPLQVFGTDATGARILSRITTSIFGASTGSFTFPLGLIVGRQDLSVAIRTPGGSTAHQHGVIQTINGGNTVTNMTGAFPTGLPMISPIAITGQFGRWTTGRVTYAEANRMGDFHTVRRADGFDVAVTTGSATRHLQVVTPWAAAVKLMGGFGFPFGPPTGIGGIAQLDIRIIPAPEPRLPVMLGLGVLGAALLRSRGRRDASDQRTRDDPRPPAGRRPLPRRDTFRSRLAKRCPRTFLT